MDHVDLARMRPPRVRGHASGLRVQEVTGPKVRAVESHTLALPPCCPVSGNPRGGSAVTVRYRPNGWCLEVYSLARVVAEFTDGFPGRGPYPPERNMEGMIGLLAQMAADALGVPVHAHASLVLDAGGMDLRVRAVPCS